MKKIINILLSVIFLIIFISFNNISAHEIFYDGTTAAPIKWHDVSNRTASLKMNGDYLKSDYSSYYYSIRVAWPNASPRVSVTNISFSDSNVDLVTASEKAWDNRWGSSYSKNIYGICDMTSTDGYTLDSYSNANSSSGLIKYASITLTPYMEVFGNSTAMKATMVHEIGHALGLGHPSADVYSIMVQGLKTFYIPKAHDLNDLNNKY